ncbi:response regulator [Pseudoroseomonas ludipueritiae]|uniref:Response regulator n=1 Tax=Pseudoroseomonas ludipueritiae TaxID=198093 RepID=A0ABR7R4B9_9PROT|nr:response regulator [Pseudoroseomonas ludipueritiae]MBC9176447.1 response regulator [Pseudoroseomonas ludipueritiae]MCG7363569.1 response regulator [Roseomonas sp. ACRSG]
MPLSRILYVEDDADVRKVATFALKMVGKFTVEACASGEEALEKAVAFAPQLLLLDVMMPGMDGPTTLARLRELPEIADVPAVFMTAKVQPQEVSRYRELGSLDVISKPFDPMTLAASVRGIWERRNG